MPRIILIISLLFTTCDATSFFSLFGIRTIPHTLEQFQGHIISLVGTMEPTKFQTLVIEDQGFQDLLRGHSMECKEFLKNNIKSLYYYPHHLPHSHTRSVDVPIVYKQYECLWDYRVFDSCLGKGPSARQQQRKLDQKHDCVSKVLDALFHYQPTPLEYARGIAKDSPRY